MQIFFQTKKIEVDPSEQDLMARRIKGLSRFFSDNTHVYIDIEQTSSQHKGHDLYYVSIRIEDGEHRYFSEEYKGDVRSAFDHAYGDMYRIVRNDRSKTRSMLKSAGRKFKKLIRRKNR